MVERMLSGISANQLAREVGVHQPTLSTWLREARSLAGVSSDEKKDPPAKPRRPEDWSPQERLAAVVEASALSEADLGPWLRRNGLHEAQLEEWRRGALEGVAPSRKATAKASQDAKRIKALERELQRKEKALAETAALLVLRKKLDALLAGEDDATGPSSDDESSS